MIKDAQKLFEKYFKVGLLTSGNFVIRIDLVDTTTLQVFGTVVDVEGFENGEQVVFDHLYDEVWRVTSDFNDHGHPVFLGEDYGGISIGS